MAGDSCLARAVVPHTAAAVDHADTELIGHDGQLETSGFFVVDASTAPARAFGPRVQRVHRVLKFDKPKGLEGCGIAFGDEVLPILPALNRHSER